MSQFFVVYGINGEDTDKTYNTGIEVEIGQTALDSSLKKVKWSDIAVHSLTKLT